MINKQYLLKNIIISKKIFFKINKFIFNSFLLKFYNQIKYNFKLIIINLFKRNIHLKKNHKLNKRLIVSLTSYPKRFRTLPLVLNSIMEQTVLPDKIILWIENKDKEKLPTTVLNFKGVDIEFCQNGLLSYKKIIPSLKKYRNSNIITLDDDFVYSKKTIEKLVSNSRKFPNDVIANRIHKINVINNYPSSYRLWSRNYMKKTKFAFFTSGAGALFPPNCFYKDVLKKNYFKKLTPYADDIWLNWMVRLNKTNVRFSKIYKNYEYIKIIKGGLYKKNFKNNYNDIQIKNMIQKYGFPFLQ